MITQNSKYSFSSDRYNLTITQFDAHDVGTYTFKASNDAGSVTVTLELILEGLPTVTNSTMYILVSLISVILLCISVGTPESSANLTGIIAGTCSTLLALVVFVIVFVFCFMRYKPSFILKHSFAACFFFRYKHFAVRNNQADFDNSSAPDTVRARDKYHRVHTVVPCMWGSTERCGGLVVFLASLENILNEDKNFAKSTK